MKQPRSSDSKAVRTRRVKPSLSDHAIADCRTFARIYHARKAETRASNEPTWNFAHLGKLTGISQNTWGEYVREERPISAKAMAWIEKLYAYPKENFKCWPRAGSPSREEAPSIVAAIAQLPEGERSALMETLRQLLNARKNRRAKIIQTMRRMLGASGKITLVKTSSA